MGKTALVTGGNKGIGLDVTRMLLEKGYSVCVVARDFSAFPLANETNVRTIAYDLSGVEGIPALVAEIGDIDVLVNNAGVMYALPYGDYPREKMERMLRVNIEAPVALMREASVSMIRNGGGRIVNNASVAGQIGHPDVWYGITKAGLINATKSFAKILGGKGVVVNAVAPGPTGTDMLEVIPLPRREAIIKAVHLGRFAKSEEVASAIVWLATESPEYINGTCIDINNGSFPR
ncbi:MAG: SDR family NAD(P)-dependent oxidoreductase [Thermodesulfobacteriota bacterium]|jgi:3-oxoacyl-[acyl-carrier protein] reductase